MRTKLYLLLLPFLLGACFDEREGTIDPGMTWVYFARTSESILESSSESLTTDIVYAGPLRDSDLNIPFTLTTDSDLTEGSDFTLAAGVLVIPAGKAKAEVVLLESVIDNDRPEGNKSLTLTISAVDGISAGFPGPDARNSSIVVNIVEDDFTVLGFTSFEEPEAGGNYEDPNGANNDHDLMNIPGLNSMDYDGSGNELGFDAVFINTRNINSGLSDNVGVTDEYAAGFTDGMQGYVLLDTDGTIRVTFDEVDVAGFDQIFISLDWYIQGTDYEGAVDNDETGVDIFRIYIITDSGEEVSLVDVDGDELERQFSDQFNTWANLFVDISGTTTAQLVIEVDTNNDSEGIAFDNVRFLGI